MRATIYGIQSIAVRPAAQASMVRSVVIPHLHCIGTPRRSYTTRGESHRRENLIFAFLRQPHPMLEQAPEPDHGLSFRFLHLAVDLRHDFAHIPHDLEGLRTLAGQPADDLCGVEAAAGVAPCPANGMCDFAFLRLYALFDAAQFGEFFQESPFGPCECAIYRAHHGEDAQLIADLGQDGADDRRLRAGLSLAEDGDLDFDRGELACVIRVDAGYRHLVTVAVIDRTANPMPLPRDVSDKMSVMETGNSVGLPLKSDFVTFVKMTLCVGGADLIGHIDDQAWI